MKLFKSFSEIDVWARKRLQLYWASRDSQGVLGLILSLSLTPLSWVYSAVQTVRRFLFRCGLFRQRALDAAVISVGGLRVGGSGKTPFTLWLADRLTSRGFKVAVLTRGYGGKKRKKNHQPCQIITHQTLPEWNPADCGDEPFLLARALPKVPVIVGADRFLAARHAEKRFSVDVYLLDDGFQHLPLKRDCDIVLLPGNEDPARMSCLPGGPLREGVSALKDADILIGVDSKISPAGNDHISGDTGRCMKISDFSVDYTAWFKPEGFYRLNGDGPLDLQSHQRKNINIFAFCGIARPETFWKVLEDMGLEIAGQISYPDHYQYSQSDYSYLMARMPVVDWMVTTEKDAVKLTGFNWPEEKILYLKIGLVMGDESRFWDRLKAMKIISL